MANQTQYDNALKNSGGDVNNPMFQQWLAKYGGNNGTAAVPYGDVAANANDFMTGQAIAPFLKNLPNYAAMVGQRSENALSNLKGQLPQDVINQISQGAAERGIATGSPGGPNANSAYLRALGLNSLQLQQQGSQDLSAAIKDTPVPELWNPMSLYVPQTLASQELSAAQAGLGRNAAAPGSVSYTGQTSGLGRTAPIPRTRNEGTVMGGSTSGSLLNRGTQFDTVLPQSSYDNWWNTYGTPAATSSGGGDYWNSPEGLQNPNRPADESLDSMINNLGSIMGGLPEFMGGGDWWNQTASQPVNQYGGVGAESYGPSYDPGDYWDDYSDDFSDFGFSDYFE